MLTQIFQIILILGSTIAVQVTVEQGTLQGFYKKTLKNRTLIAFERIPYGEPPVGDLRFKPPVRAKSWKGVKFANISSPLCIQHNIYSPVKLNGEEDCLHLDIYTPCLNRNLPVMVFFHGGAFVFGGNPEEFTPTILLDQDVVFVLVHYRLGAFGFLSTGDHISPGNYGLKDQVLALQWTQKNIGVFGGNPRSVTIFGESAGGASVHFHILSHLSKGLFHKAISESGVAINPWVLEPSNGQNARNTRKLAKAFNCNGSNNKLIECLRQVPALDILAQDHIFEEWDVDPITPFKPVIESKLPGAFITEHPIEIMKSGKFNQVPWIMGVSTNEGCFKVPRIYGKQELLKEFSANFNELLPIFLQYDQTANPLKVEEITRKLRRYYLGTEDLNENTRMNFVDLVSDGFFVYGADVIARLFTKYSNSSLYYYQFDYKGTFTYAGLMGDPTRDYGTCHSDELPILFDTRKEPLQQPNVSYSVKDRRMSDILTTLWTNFAKTGNPTPDPSEKIPNQWSPLKSENMEYFYINVDRQIMKKGLFEDRMKLWRSFGNQVHP